eukprot:COSAG05_NODE_15271_length_373_cov_4.390511_1_plen_59_part_10
MAAQRSAAAYILYSRSRAGGPGPSKGDLVVHARRAAKNRGGGGGAGNLVSCFSTVACCT